MDGQLILYADEVESRKERRDLRFVTGHASYSAARRAALARSIAQRKELFD